MSPPKKLTLFPGFSDITICRRQKWLHFSIVCVIKTQHVIVLLNQYRVKWYVALQCSNDLSGETIFLHCVHKVHFH